MYVLKLINSMGLLTKTSADTVLLVIMVCFLLAIKWQHAVLIRT